MSQIKNIVKETWEIEEFIAQTKYLKEYIEELEKELNNLQDIHKELVSSRNYWKNHYIMMKTDYNSLFDDISKAYDNHKKVIE